MRREVFIASCIVLCVLIGCAGGGRQPADDGPRVISRDYNFMLVAQNLGIDDPDRDLRCYYKVFIDKVEEGRTEIALDSQKKYFKATLRPNRHLLKVEKWVLDQRQEKYVKPNNIDQPRPDFLYFDVPESGTVSVELIIDRTGAARYQVSID